MEQLPNSLTKAQEARVRASLEAFMDLLDNDAEQDVYREAFRQAMAQEMRTGGPLHQTVVSMFMTRQDMGPSHAYTQVMRSFNYAMWGADEGYPREYTTPARWRLGFADVYDDEAIRERFVDGVLVRDLQSNVTERYKGIKAFINSERAMGRLATCRVLDVGCSLNLGNKALAMGLPFGHTDIVDKSGRHMPRDTDGFAQLVYGDLENFEVWGLDKSDPVADLPYARACSFNPADLMRPDKIQAFDDLVDAQPANVHRIQADFEDLDPDGLRQLLPDGQVDIITFSTVLYGQSPLGRAAMLALAAEVAQDSVIVQDFCGIGTKGGTRFHLNFHDNWRRGSYPYRTVVGTTRPGLSSRRSSGWRNVLWWTDGRVTQATLPLGRRAHMLARKPEA